MKHKKGNRKMSTDKLKKTLIAREATSPFEAIRNSSKLPPVNPRILAAMFKKE